MILIDIAIIIIFITPFASFALHDELSYNLNIILPLLPKTIIISFLITMIMIVIVTIIITPSASHALHHELNHSIILLIISVLGNKITQQDKSNGKKLTRQGCKKLHSNTINITVIIVVVMFIISIICKRWSKK